MGLIQSRKLLKVLFDTESTTTLISRKAQPKDAVEIPLANSRQVNTIAGSMKAEKLVRPRDISLPMFDNNRKIDKKKALVFDQECRYDVILGADFLTNTDIDVKYSTGTVHWFENVRPMREPWALDNKEYHAMATAFDIQSDDELIGEDWLDSYLINTILDTKYEGVDVHAIARK